jgi:hypothetical protein
MLFLVAAGETGFRLHCETAKLNYSFSTILTKLLNGCGRLFQGKQGRSTRACSRLAPMRFTSGCTPFRQSTSGQAQKPRSAQHHFLHSPQSLVAGHHDPRNGCVLWPQIAGADMITIAQVNRAHLRPVKRKAGRKDDITPCIE